MLFKEFFEIFRAAVLQNMCDEKQFLQIHLIRIFKQKDDSTRTSDMTFNLLIGVLDIGASFC